MSALTVSMSDVERDVELDLDIPGGSTLALLGPNGAGKSTLLAAVAGTRQVPGSLRLGGRDLHRLPPHRRRIPLLSQDPLLLPHLSVLDNVAFGPRASGASRRTARAQAQEWLERAGVAQLAQRRATDLSGGQAQRVGIARALATRPEAILLDEPLAALDVDARPAVRHLLGEILADITTILVTHDIVDAVLLADDTAVLVDGRVVEHRPVRDLLAAPRTPFAARISGVNLVTGRSDGSGGVVTEGGTVAGLPDSPPAKGDPAVATFRPEDVAVSLSPPGGSPRNAFAGRVSAVEPAGSALRLRVATPIGTVLADLTPSSVADLHLAPGSEVHIAVKATAVAVQPA